MSSFREPLKEFVWNDEFQLSYDAMDETHREFVTTFRAKKATVDSDFLAAYESFVQHIEQHFAEENRRMNQRTSLQKNAATMNTTM